MSISGRVRGAAKAAIVRRAHDLTDSAASRSAVVVAPHPDDETLGCGAAILLKRAAGTAVTIAMVTDGRHSHRSFALGPDELAVRRRAELIEAARRLDVSPKAVRWLDFDDGAVAGSEDRLVEAIGELLDELAPDELYATSAEEPHPDHAAVGRAARRAVASRPKVTLLEYPVWLWGAWPLRAGDRIGSLIDAVARALRRGAVVVRTDGLLAGKLHALDAHRTQLARPLDVPSDEDWAVLPRQVMEAAAGPMEVFFPVDPAR